MQAGLPFEDSRRLTGSNLFFAGTGAVLEVPGAWAPNATLWARWREHVQRARAQLDWEAGPLVTRVHATGTSLALSAPCDQLFVATEVNEWALCAALRAQDPQRWAGLEQALRSAALAAAPAAGPGAGVGFGSHLAADLPLLDEAAALARLARLARVESRPDLRTLLGAAREHGLAHLLDETTLTLGSGAGGIDYALEALPAPSAVPWPGLHDVPTAVVTGSNGKTTTVRLIAACARAQDWCSGYNCTDGVWVGAEPLALGDYAGPAGARLVLRDRRVRVALLEVARGGILRRGMAVSQAQVALVTNVSADHFGEYGIDDLDGLADVKLSVAKLLNADGLLVLNAEDATLRAKACGLAERLGAPPTVAWFALEADHPLLCAHRARGAPTCGARGGRLVLDYGGRHDLGAIVSMPLSAGGIAHYNIANLAGAALAAAALGVSPARIAAVFARFGADPQDNAGRLMRFDVHGVQVLLDYAHNPEGLKGLLEVARALRDAQHGRLGLILGHAGNRQDADLQAVAAVAAAFRPDLIVVKEDESHLRGRAPGEVPRVIRSELLRLGLPPELVPLRESELQAVQCALEWARPGDVLALPVHGTGARAATLEIIGRRQQLPFLA